MIHFLKLSLLIPLFIFVSASQASALGETITRQGNGQGALACISCHGDRGQGNATAGYPYLAGQPADYLMKQLRDFASGQRLNPVMQPFAKALSKKEIKAVALYYAGLPFVPPTANASSKIPSESGERLATRGKWSVGVPACFQCHGDRGQGIAPVFPAISGQSAAYIKKQLEHWRQGERTNDPVGLMQAVVSKLNQEEIAAVSHYLASHSPVAKK